MSSVARQDPAPGEPTPAGGAGRAPQASAVVQRGALTPAGGAAAETSRRDPAPARGAARGYYPTDVVMLFYLLLAGIALLVSPLRFPERPGLAAAYYGLLLLVALLRFAPRTGHPVWLFLRHWYFFLSLPFLYGSVSYLNRLLTMRYFDSEVARIDQVIFGVQPSQVLHGLLPFAPLSEFLHLSYLLYLGLVPLVGMTLYLRGRRKAYREFATTALLVYLSCYLLFILIPVRGPFHFFGPLDPLPVGSFFASLVSGMLHSGSSAGTAFPSSHVAAAVAIWIVSRRYQRWISKIVGVLVAGIFVGTVYGGFHYAVDAVAGLAMGILLGVYGRRIHVMLERVTGYSPDAGS